MRRLSTIFARCALAALAMAFVLSAVWGVGIYGPRIGRAEEEDAPQEQPAADPAEPAEAPEAPQDAQAGEEHPQDEASSDEATPQEQPADDEEPPADAAAGQEAPQQQLDPPELKHAQGAVVLDQGGNVLFAQDPELELPPASITKVMTAMVALDSSRPLDEEVELVQPEFGAYSQMADFGTGDRITFGELLRVMLVYSANDAAWNVALITAGTEEAFADLMNAKAAELGMSHTHFVNSHGLEDDGHYSCAYDIAIMGRYAMEHYPYIAQCVCLPSATAVVRGQEVVFGTTDKLLDSYPGMRGVKTGAVAENYTFLGASGRGDVQLYTAVLGCKTGEGRFEDTATLMDWAYGHFENMQLSHHDWIVRVQPFAFDFGRRAIISAAADTLGRLWPAGEPTSYSSVLSRSNRLLDVGKPYGWTDWSQSGRTMGTSFYATRPLPVRVSSWPVFSLPLFADTSSLGR